MTQYNPSPYPGANQPPMSGYVQADPYAAQGAGGNLKMCRAAAVAQIVIACLMLGCGCCAGFYGFALSTEFQSLSSEQQQQLDQAKALLGDEGVHVLVLDSCAMVTGSLLQIAFGWWVWRGRRWAIRASIGAAVLTALMAISVIAYCLLNELAIGLCFNGLLILLQTGLSVALAFAMRESSASQAAKAAYEAQWQQYYQQQYQYQLALQQQAASAQQPSPPPPAAPSAPPQTAPLDQPGGNEPPLPPPAGA